MKTTQDKINDIKILLEEVIEESTNKALLIKDTNKPLQRCIETALIDYKTFLKNKWLIYSHNNTNELYQRLDAFDLDETIKNKN